MIFAVGKHYLRHVFGQHLGHIVNNGHQSTVLHESVMPFLNMKRKIFLTGNPLGRLQLESVRGSAFRVQQKRTQDGRVVRLEYEFTAWGKQCSFFILFNELIP